MNKTAGWIFGFVFLGATVYWLTLPPDSVALDDDCHPGDPQAAVSAWLHGRSFWQGQKLATEEALRAEISLLASKEKRRDQMSDPHNSIEQRMTRLSNRDVSGDEQAAAQAQREQLARMSRLTRCQVDIERHLAE